MGSGADEQATLAQHEAAMAELRRYPGVVRVAFGLKESGGEVVPEWAYRVYVERKIPAAELRPEERIPYEIGGFRTDVIVDGKEVKRPDKKTPTLAPGDKISRYIPNDWQEGGTLGLLVRKGTDRFILTNHHVLSDDAGVTDFSKNVYSPQRKTSAGLECNNPAAQIIPNNGVRGRREFESKTYFIDATLATIYAGVNGSNVAGGIGAYDQGLRDLATVPATGNAPTDPVTVRKKGGITGVTQGTVVKLFGEIEVDGAPVTEWEFEVRPTSGSSFAFQQDYVLGPGENADEVVGRFAGKAVTATKEVSGERTIIHLTGHIFSQSGDSGSVVVDSARRIVGLHWGHSGTNVNVMIDGRPEMTFLPFGNGLACYVRPVFNAMGLNEATGVIPPGSPSSGALMDMTEATGPEWHDADRGVEEVEAVLRQTAAGRKLLALAYRHAEQLADLVHHRRRVKVTWYRSRGPAYAATLLNALREPEGRIPADISGVSLVQALTRMRAVLLQEGDHELREAVQENGDFILQLAAHAESVPRLIEALRAREEACSPS